MKLGLSNDVTLIVDNGYRELIISHSVMISNRFVVLSLGISHCTILVALSNHSG